MTKKTRIILLCAVAAVLVAAVATTVSCCFFGKKPDDTPTPTAPVISLSVNVYQLAEDEIFTITAATTSTDMIRWTSSEPAVASVSAQGRVIAKSVGETVITAAVGGESAACKITVVENRNARTVVSFDEPVIRLSRGGDAQTIDGTVKTPEGQSSTLAQAGAVYESADPMVARVSSDGTVTPVSVGSTTVLVTVAGRTKAVAVEVYTMLVGTPDDWNAMLALPGDPGARFYVTADIDFAGRTYYRKEITGDGRARLEECFSGTLDGGGHTLRNVTFDKKHSEQSLFGSVVGMTLRHITFENIHFTAGKAAGIATRMLAHYDGTDENGSFTGQMIFAPGAVSDVCADFVFDYHGACGIASTYYGGSIENVFLTMRMSDGSAMQTGSDYPIAEKSMVWFASGNSVNHLVVLTENGGLNPNWDNSGDGKYTSADLSLLYLCTGRMEAGYYVRTLFDMSLWTVTPGQLPKLK